MDQRNINHLGGLYHREFTLSLFVDSFLASHLKIGSAVILTPVELFAPGKTCAVELLVGLAVLARPLKERQGLAAFFAHKVGHFSRLSGYRLAVHVIVCCAAFLLVRRAGKEIIFAGFDVLEWLATLLAGKICLPSQILRHRPAVHIVVGGPAGILGGRAGKEVVLFGLDMLERLAALFTNEIRHCRLYPLATWFAFLIVKGGLAGAAPPARGTILVGVKPEMLLVAALGAGEGVVAPERRKFRHKRVMERPHAGRIGKLAFCHVIQG